MEENLVKSLQQLQLDYVDLYLIHFPICVQAGSTSSKDPSASEPQPTDHLAVWKVCTHYYVTNIFHFLTYKLETGRASRQRQDKSNRCIQLQLATSQKRIRAQQN